jgi:hypothetical protein
VRVRSPIPPVRFAAPIGARRGRAWARQRPGDARSDRSPMRVRAGAEAAALRRFGASAATRSNRSGSVLGKGQPLPLWLLVFHTSVP